MSSTRSVGAAGASSSGTCSLPAVAPVTCSLCCTGLAVAGVPLPCCWPLGVHQLAGGCAQEPSTMASVPTFMAAPSWHTWKWRNWNTCRAAARHVSGCCQPDKPFQHLAEVGTQDQSSSNSWLSTQRGQGRLYCATAGERHQLGATGPQTGPQEGMQRCATGTALRLRT